MKAYDFFTGNEEIAAKAIVFVLDSIISSFFPLKIIAALALEFESYNKSIKFNDIELTIKKTVVHRNL